MMLIKYIFHHYCTYTDSDVTNHSRQSANLVFKVAMKKGFIGSMCRSCK